MPLRLSALVPPFREARFWATQALIGAIALVHTGLEALGVIQDASGAGVVETSFFFIPLIYASLHYGAFGAVATAIWVTFLSMPNWIIAHDGWERAGVIFQMFVVDAVAVFVGISVDGQKRAQVKAEAAARALELSERKYRGLFETAGEAILVYDGRRQVLECNSAACALFDLPMEVSLRGLPSDKLPAKVAAVIAGAADGSYDSDEEFLLGHTEGGDVWVQFLATAFADGEDLVQVVARNVSEHKSRQAGLQSYAAQILSAQEAERRRIAQELHDETIQSLLLLCRKLDDSDISASNGKRNTPHVLREARADVESIVASVRTFAHGLRPPTLDDLGLTAAIDRLVTEVSARSGIEGKFLVRGSGRRRLQPDAELGLFRIAQEALHNVERHSGATEVTVSLSFEPERTELTVNDNGRGFAVPKRLDDLAGQQKLGMLGMQERARMLGGAITIRSTPAAGSRVAAEIPAE